ncbi:Ribosomal large subunit pseudouridine synthase B [hydrothermal vent metagenome]|uniref:Ribosomal large subunit pseudouridine synthase B n=1 Tax=hydrothermal vent metagenome TaxID=652676 RepID=A0A3B1BJP2_9ZZZZ
MNPQTKKSASQQKSLKRLHKIISSAGVCSLREAERLIVSGRVSVNNKTVDVKGSLADPEKDSIRVDGKIVRTRVSLVYIALNKPKGFVTTRSDELGRKTVMSLLPKNLAHLYPVGRLDIQSEGLLLFTNDGQFAQSIISSGSGVKRVYMVKVRNIPGPRMLKKMTTGVTIDNRKLKARQVELMEVTGKNAWLKITLTEGKNLHIRKLCLTLGFPVLKLKRISVGPVKLLDLKSGEARHIEIEMVNKMKKNAARNLKRK